MKTYPTYTGSLDQSKISGHVKTAYQCFNNQRRRCYTKTNPRYKDNGAKGIRVLYSVREFIYWYLENIRHYEGTRPSVGRIDHSKDYSFDNIKIESLADNSMERIIRVGPTRPRRPVWAIHKSGKVTFCVSGSEAAKLTGVQDAHISKYCDGILKRTYGGYTFRYVDQSIIVPIISF